MTSLDFEQAAAVHLASLQRWLTSEHERVASLREQALKDKISDLQRENLNLQQTPTADRERFLEDRISSLQRENLELRKAVPPAAPPAAPIPTPVAVPVVAAKAWPDLIDPALETDSAAVLAENEVSGKVLPFAADTVKAEKEVVLAAVKESGKVLPYAADTVKAEKEVVLAAVKENGTRERGGTPDAEAQTLSAQTVLEETLLDDTEAVTVPARVVLEESLLEAEEVEKARSVLESMMLTDLGETAARHEARICLDDVLCDESSVAAKCEERAAPDLALHGELHSGNRLEKEMLQNNVEERRMLAYRKAALAMSEQERDRQQERLPQGAEFMLGEQRPGEQCTIASEGHSPSSMDSSQLSTMSKVESEDAGSWASRQPCARQAVEQVLPMRGQAVHRDFGGSTVSRPVESTETLLPRRQGQPASRGFNHPYLAAVLQESSSQTSTQQTGESRDSLRPTLGVLQQQPEEAPAKGHCSSPSCSKDRRPLLSASTSAAGSDTPSPSALRIVSKEQLPAGIPANSQAGARVPPAVAGKVAAKTCRSPIPESVATAQTPRGAGGSVVSELRKARMAAARHRSQPPRQ